MSFMRFLIHEYLIILLGFLWIMSEVYIPTWHERVLFLFFLSFLNHINKKTK